MTGRQRHTTILPVAAALLLTFAAGAAGAQNAGAPACTSNGDASVAALSQDWILVGWERNAGDGPLDFRQKLGKYYDWSSPDIVLCDDFDPQHRVVRSPTAYGAIWEPGSSALNTAHHRLAMGPFVLNSGDLAVATLQ